jgi:hypothetical protein
MTESIVPKKVVFVPCMDMRETDRTGDVMKVAFPDQKVGVYTLTEPGGALVLLNIFGGSEGNGPADWLMRKIELSVQKVGCVEVLLAAHGTSACDGKCCAGLKLAGFADKFETPESSRTFVVGELEKAIRLVREKLSGVKVRGAYITFGENGENIAEMVDVAGVAA